MTIRWKATEQYFHMVPHGLKHAVLPFSSVKQINVICFITSDRWITFFDFKMQRPKVCLLRDDNDTLKSRDVGQNSFGESGATVRDQVNLKLSQQKRNQSI